MQTLHLNLNLDLKNSPNMKQREIKKMEKGKEIG